MTAHRVRKLRIFKCTNPECQFTKSDGEHWVVAAGWVNYTSPSWDDAMGVALVLARRAARLELEPSC